VKGGAGEREGGSVSGCGDEKKGGGGSLNSVFFATEFLPLSLLVRRASLRIEGNRGGKASALGHQLSLVGKDAIGIGNSSVVGGSRIM